MTLSVGLALLSLLYVLSLTPDLAHRFGGVTGLATAVAIVLLQILSVLLHELGHFAAGRAMGTPASRIDLHALGGLTHFHRGSKTPKEEALTAGAGPAVTVALSALGWAMVGLGSLSGPGLLLAHYFAVSNSIVAAFNLLPVLPLDGGRLVVAGLWKLMGDQRTARSKAFRLGARLGQGGAVVVPVTIILLQGLSSGFWAVWTGAWMFRRASALLRRTQGDVAENQGVGSR